MYTKHLGMKGIDIKKIGLSVLGAIVCVAIIGGVYWAGYTQGSQDPKHIVVEGVLDPQLSKDGADFKPFWEAWSLIKEKFVSKEKTSDNQALVYGAIRGMVDALGDPNTNFFTPQDAEDFSQEISGEFSGIGAEIGINTENQIVIIAPLKDTPAFRAGIQAGDRVLPIDEKDTNGFSVERAVELIRGQRGTIVHLLLLRKNEEIEKNITRDVVVLPTIEVKHFDSKGNEKERGDITYVRLYNFYEKAATQFQQAAAQAASQNTKGIILDLRGNPGGYLESAVYIAGWFIKGGEVVVREEFRNTSENRELVSKGPFVLKNIPIVVMLDRGSASASEILAGALREKAGAIIMGEKSFGKGTVQELIPLLDDSMVKVTIAHWVTPNGSVIDKNGIQPDISLTSSTSSENMEKDEWLEQAIRELVKKI